MQKFKKMPVILSERTGYALFSVAVFFTVLLYAGQSSRVAHEEIMTDIAANKSIIEIVFFIMINILNECYEIYMRRNVQLFYRKKLKLQ